MTTYLVKRPFTWNGKQVQAGDELELSEDSRRDELLIESGNVYRQKISRRTTPNKPQRRKDSN